MLSWSLVVATYDRADVLAHCIRLAFNQTYKPSEIVIIDASKDWLETRDRILLEADNKHRIIYEQAHARSITLQRNQGLSLATGDVVFLFDDDSFMHPTCAEEIMRVYEADVTYEVKGVQAATADLPGNLQFVGKRKNPENPKQIRQPRLGKLRSWVWSRVLLMDPTQLFIPYDGTFHVPEIPASLHELNVMPVPLFQGYRMTFRREAISREKFESSLLYYAAGEDLDASYRVSRHGCLLMAIDAKLHHFNSGGGRLSRHTVSLLSSANQALLIRKNATGQIPSYYFLLLRRIAAEGCKDILTKRWRLPQMRGVLASIGPSIKIFTLSPDDVEKWYHAFQQRVLRER